jgi:sugar (pentulose or hexulose) kinase
MKNRSCQKDKFAFSQQGVIDTAVNSIFNRCNLPAGNSMKDVILVFDIGKTNKKVLLFNDKLKVEVEEEIKIQETVDEDGFPCDDIEKLEAWIDNMLEKFLTHKAYRVKAVNFATYGATLMHLDKAKNRLTPVYNYLKPFPDDLAARFHEKYGGKEEFSRKTASPVLGMLNSGLQLLWLKNYRLNVFNKIASSLHFPQYLASRLTGAMVSEHTSIGCHTAMWDFDRMSYHPWLKDEGIQLPEPVSADTVFEANFHGKKLKSGIGIHDSSASLAPYILGSKEEFILLSTGTWCINMNPFNNTPLTAEQLEKDCLCFLSINEKPVKSSRVFLGHIHDVNLARLTRHFKLADDEYKKVVADTLILSRLMKNPKPGTKFFNNGVPENYVDESVDLSGFNDFTEAYHQLMIDLTRLVVSSINLILPVQDNSKIIFISGGFAKNDLFTGLLASHFKDKEVYTSNIANSSSLGAALVLYKQFGLKSSPKLDLDLRRVKKFNL